MKNVACHVWAERNPHESKMRTITWETSISDSSEKCWAWGVGADRVEFSIYVILMMGKYIKSGTHFAKRFCC